MKVFGLLALLFLGPFNGGGCSDKENETQCRADCSTYNAEYEGVNYIGHESYECWCRRGVEPLRIW